MFWKARSASEYQAAVRSALDHNVRYSQADVMGFPGSFLDQAIYPDGAFLADKPFLSCLRENPNHIDITLAEVAGYVAGVHLGKSGFAFLAQQKSDIEAAQNSVEKNIASIEDTP